MWFYIVIVIRLTDMIEKKIEEAMNIVKKIPEPYHSIAFGIVLKHLLSETNTTITRQHKPVVV